MTTNAAFQREVELFKGHGGFLRTSQAIKLGIHPRALYGMREAKIIEPVSRGLFHLAETPMAHEAVMAPGAGAAVGSQTNALPRYCGIASPRYITSPHAAVKVPAWANAVVRASLNA